MARVDEFAIQLQIVSRASSGRLIEWGSEAGLGTIGASIRSPLWRFLGTYSGCHDVSDAPRTSSLSTCNLRSSMLEALSVRLPRWARGCFEAGAVPARS